MELSQNASKEQAEYSNPKPGGESPPPQPEAVAESSDNEAKLSNDPRHPIARPITENVNSQNEAMEVHKHPHHVTHTKKWTEYLLEFFMIFFAVTMGFYAENIREHISAANTEKEYMGSMIEDLRQDTANCRRVIARNEAIIRGLDTLVTYILNPARDEDNINLIYAYCIKYRYSNPEVHFSERTMSQLKNNGGLRLVKKRDVSDALSTYDQGIRFCDRQRDQVLHYYGVLDETELALFDFGPIKPLWDSLFSTDVLSVPITTMTRYLNGKVRLQPTGGDQLKKYMNGIIYDEVAIASYNNDLSAQNQKAVSLIELIRKKYRLSDD